MKRTTIPIGLAAILLLILAASLPADSMRTLSYQGFLRDSTGAPVDGAVSVTFRIYGQEVGGSPLWSEPEEILDADSGYIDAIMGVIYPIEDLYPDENELYLEIEINDQVIEPRVPLSGTMFTMSAYSVDGLLKTEPGGMTVPNLQNPEGNVVHLYADSSGSGIQIRDDFDQAVATYDEEGFQAIPIHLPQFASYARQGVVLSDSLTGDTSIIIAANGENEGGSVTITEPGDEAASVVLDPRGLTFALPVPIPKGDGNRATAPKAHYTAESMFIFDDIGDTAILIDEEKIMMINGAADGYVLTSDANGVGSWQAPSGGGNSGWIDTGSDVVLIDSMDRVGIGGEHIAIKLNIESPDYWYVTKSEYTGTDQFDARGIYGVSTPQDYYGIGGEFLGGYIGCYGHVSPTGIERYEGVHGAVAGGNGFNYGVHGNASGDSLNWGVLGEAYDGDINIGVMGDAAVGTVNYGLYGIADGDTCYGVYGEATGYGAKRYGIYGKAVPDENSFAGYFDGDVDISGNLSKSTGSFKIDHPLDPTNKYLYHSFVESPDMMNVYNGNIITDAQGKAIVELPSYFSVLNRDFRYQLTVIGEFAQAIIAEEIENNQFIIETDKPDVKVSWQVTGIRKDPYAVENPIEVEVDKPDYERGTYLHPEAYKKAPELGVHYNQDQARKQQMEEQRMRREADREKLNQIPRP